MAEDVTEARMREAEAAHLASHDVLTGLPNRWLFHKRFSEARREVSRGACRMAVHYVDLDGFKGVNDTRGHASGDQLLTCVAVRMLQIVRRHDVVARFGGDEFAVLQTGVRSAEEARSLAERLVHALSEPYDFGGSLCRVGASVGVCLADPETPIERIIEQADGALYAAKRAGRGQYVLHTVANADLRGG